ncbi:double-strand break repair protein AddB [Roseibacterium beibuensis]|uniref:double-strand break repair protein AddB n=1 Tax=[Roseibacterium] beibuensis TaxID=1193142 RepID=UPI00217EA866|nr:double-strand break repair protein AddB [Roseibacterium beibuensis]MCS6626250.1 double-strand break repair protein AddB [Roseibacterium beibuensis]
MTARFDPFAPAGPRWYAVEARRPFLEDLAAGVLDWLGEHPPEALSDAVILLPNRRAARAFTSALTRLAGDRPVLLPQVRPLGDLEEDEPPFAPGELGLDLPPAIAPLTRRFEMARMIVEEFQPGLSPLRALEMADALGGFLDSCQLEEVEDIGRVATLVEGDLAEHWRESARFLGLAVEAWPKRLTAMGMVDPAWRRARLLRLLADAWRERPPTQPVIAAGSTGTAPAAADVLAAVAAAPQGCVVLPGLDRDLDPAVWSQLRDNEQHPQNALWRLLDRHGVEREAVRPWFVPVEDAASALGGRARQRLINEALRPADATDDWRALIRTLRDDAFRERSADPIAEGLDGLSVVTVRAEEDAAATLALMMREALETPGRTCALVTPDLALGRRVAARLERWGVIADNSSGQPLSRMPAGRLVDLAVRFVADPLDPHALLGLLKHPLVRFDLDGVAPAIAIDALEEYGLRGPRRRDWARARRALLRAAEPRDDGKARSEHTVRRVDAAGRLLDRLEGLSDAARAPFAHDAPLDAAARALTALIEALAGPDAWAGPDGEAAAALLAGLIEGGASLGAVSRAEFSDLVRTLLTEETVRTGGANQPRLRILGAIEARLVRADRMILAGLEEGVWPNAAPTDPFLSRPMRESLGLPPPERRLGQTAQDFVQAACADEAILVHSERRGGQPAVKSRWLWRLEMLTRGANSETTPVELERTSIHLDQARALDAPARATPDYAPRPAPRPPVERRPRELPVTGVERWVRDPYAIYARYVLNLRQMDRPGQSAEALARGNAVHKAVERLTLAWPEVLPDDCAGELETLLLEELGDHGFEDAAMARETPLARNCARWLSDWEAGRRARGVEIRVEEKVQMMLPAPFGLFKLTAKADRIELSSTGAAVLDFKTGSIPSPKQVKSGFSPQLTLTGAILAHEGLSDTGPVPPEELTYVRVVGRKVPGQAAVRASGEEAAALSEAALEGLETRIARFDDPNTPYLSWVAPQFMGTFGGNYDHLARVWEWHVVGGEDSGDAE